MRAHLHLKSLNKSNSSSVPVGSCLVPILCSILLKHIQEAADKTQCGLGMKRFTHPLIITTHEQVMEKELIYPQTHQSHLSNCRIVGNVVSKHCLTRQEHNTDCWYFTLNQLCMVTTEK